jgi:hypothetical protein
MFVTLKVFKLIGPSNDGRRHGRGTYLFLSQIGQNLFFKTLFDRILLKERPSPFSSFCLLLQSLHACSRKWSSSRCVRLRLDLALMQCKLVFSDAECVSCLHALLACMRDFVYQGICVQKTLLTSFSLVLDLTNRQID